MFTVTAFTHFVEGLKAIHRQNRTERAIRELPPELLRDIGWEEGGRNGAAASRRRLS